MWYIILLISVVVGMFFLIIYILLEKHNKNYLMKHVCLVISLLFIIPIAMVFYIVLGYLLMNNTLCNFGLQPYDIISLIIAFLTLLATTFIAIIQMGNQEGQTKYNNILKRRELLKYIDKDNNHLYNFCAMSSHVKTRFLPNELNDDTIAYVLELNFKHCLNLYDLTIENICIYDKEKIVKKRIEKNVSCYDYNGNLYIKIKKESDFCTVLNNHIQSYLDKTNCYIDLQFSTDAKKNAMSITIQFKVTGLCKKIDEFKYNGICPLDICVIDIT